MSLSKTLSATGMPAIQAANIGGDVANTLTALGTTQATALGLGAGINRCTTVAAGTGVQLPVMNPGDSVIVINKGANALLVYPQVGGTINALAGNAGYSVATATPFSKFVCIDANTIVAFQSA